MNGSDTLPGPAVPLQGSGRPAAKPWSVLAHPKPVSPRRRLRSILILLAVVLLPLTLYAAWVLSLPWLSSGDRTRAEAIYRQADERASAAHASAPSHDGYRLLAPAVGSQDATIAALANLDTGTPQDTLQNLAARPDVAGPGIKALRMTLPAIEAALGAPAFRCPPTPANLATLARLGDSLRILGYRDEADGRGPAAVRDYTDALRIGCRLAARTDLAGLRAAIAVQARALEPLIAMLQSGEIEAPSAALALRRLHALPSGACDMVNALDQDYVFHMQQFDALATHRPVDLDLVTARVSPLFVHLVVQSPFLVARERRLYQGFFLKYRPYCAALRTPRANDLVTDTLAMRSAYYSVLAAAWIPDFLPVQDRFKEVATARSAALLLAALQVYRARRLTYPRALQALTPALIHRLPPALLSPNGSFTYSAGEAGLTLTCPDPRGERVYVKDGGPGVFLQYRY